MNKEMVKNARIKTNVKNRPDEFGPLLNRGKYLSVLLARPTCAKGDKTIAIEITALYKPKPSCPKNSGKRNIILTAPMATPM